jgi:acylphosphatase
MRKRVVVHGRVQGVFFRDSARQRAQAAGVVGWVANRPDGTVEAVFEGEAEAVEALVGWMHDGPRGAQVERVEVTEEEPDRLRNFDVR